jgi:hypothetical protein
MAPVEHFSWIVNGEEYDLTDFLDKHPGGPDFLLWSKGRDVTVAVYAYHKDPERIVMPLLEKYKVQKPADKKEVVKEKLGIPHFLLPKNFDAVSAIPKYDFDFENEKLLLNSARNLILQKDSQAEIKRLDRLFDLSVFGCVIAYLSLVCLWLNGFVPWWLSVPLFTVLRTGIAGGGHYYVHRKRPCFADCLFDINYVGMAYTAQDGHVLIHHLYTQSDADVKRGFFGGMMGVPRLFRIPVHTLHKLGHVTTGMFIRGVELEYEPSNDEHQGVPMYTRQRYGRSFNWSFWLIHTWLRVELCLALYCGLGWSWLGQFCVCLWFNTLMVVSSHDFTETLAQDTKDWAKYQLLNAHDMSITGNRWLDCFLSAGLSPHRAHHIFPWQKSGFANIYSEQHLAAAAKKHGLPWLPNKFFFTEILPVIFRMYLWSPVADPIVRKPHYDSFIAEHMEPTCYRYIVDYIYAGFKGIGSL